MGKKKFIDKKKSATFQLLARDSSDSNYADEPGSDRVFIRVDNNPVSVDSFCDGGNPNDASANGDSNSIFADAPEDDEDGENDGRFFRNSTRSGSVNNGDDQKARTLPEDIRKEILELGFPDDGYNYLIHLREIRNTGGGCAFYHNPKAKLDQLPRDMKAYDASRIRISKVDKDPSDKSIYSVASNTIGLRIQKAFDPEVSALLDDSDLSRFGSDAEDLEEDFVVQANCPEGERNDDINIGLNVLRNSRKVDHLIYLFLDFSTIPPTLIAKTNELLLYESVPMKSCIRKRDDSGPPQVADYVDSLMDVTYHLAGVGVDCGTEEPRVRRPLDEQFDLLEHQEYGSDDDNDGNSYDGYAAGGDESLVDKLKHSLNDRYVGDIKLEGYYKTPAEVLREKDEPTIEETVESSADVIRRCIEYAQKYENEMEDKDVVIVEESSEESEVWDCETVVSTYSNLDNHPGKIEAPEIITRKKLTETTSGSLNSSSYVISLRGKEKLPVGYLPVGRKTSTEKVKAIDSVGTKQHKRNQHGQESKEEKKERKAAIKEERREARRAKKEMKELYRCEAHRAQRVAAITDPASIPLL